MSVKLAELAESTARYLDAIRSGAMPVPPLFEPSLYESPLERDFAWNAVKYLERTAILKPQHWVSAEGRNYRMDFMLSARDGRLVGIECDGRGYHLNRERDDMRDRAILEAGELHAIYRLRGQDVFWLIEDVFYLLHLYEPQLFSERGARNLNHLASESAKNANHYGPLVIAEYQDEENGFSYDLQFVIRKPGEDWTTC